MVNEDDIDIGDLCADCGCEIGPDTSENGFQCDDCAEEGACIALDDEYYEKWVEHNN